MKPGNESVRTFAGKVLRRCALATVATLSLLLATRSASAAHAEVALDYDGEADTASCSGPDELRAAVAARLGYDPFVDAGSVDTVVVRIRRLGTGLQGTIERRGASQPAHGKAATIVSKSGDCKELAASLAVGIAIAIDPLSITREAPTPGTPPTATQAPAPSPPAPPAPPRERVGTPEPSVPLRVALGAAPSIAVGALPAASFGVRSLVGVSRGLWEVDLEGRFDAPVSAQAQGGSIEASLVLGTVAPCLRHWLVIACGEVSLGALRGTGLGFDHTREGNTFYIAAGARAGLEVGLGRQFAVRVFLEGQVPLRPTRLEAEGQPVWSTPAFEFAAVPMLLGRFP